MPYRLEGGKQKRYRAITQGSPNCFSSLGIATTGALLQAFDRLSWRMQEVRKSQNQDLRSDPAWSINSGKITSRPGDFPGFRRLRAAASSSGLKVPEILFSLVLGSSIGRVAGC